MAKDEHIASVKKHTKEGDLISHTRCLGELQEHIFTGWDGEWMMGMPTTETMYHSATTCETNDIAPSNVTHINRAAIDCLDMNKELETNG